MSPNRAHKNLSFALPQAAAWVAAMVVAAGAVIARADDAAKIKINRSVVVGAAGDAQVKVEVKLSAESYSLTKANCAKTAILLRRLGAGNDWTKLEGAKSRFEDDTNSFVVEYTHVGLARMTGDDTWEIALGAGAKYEQLAEFETTAILTTTHTTDLGEATVNVRIEIPKGGKDLRLEHSPERLTYRFAPTLASGTSPQATFALEGRSQLMSILARPCADSRFADLWAARSIFKNTGDQTLSDYRVHYRIAGFSNWSEWKKARRVLPSQTIVDPFFPVLDLEKLTQLASSRQVMLEVEYEYRQQDGRTVRENDSRQIQLLGRNQAVFSSLSADEAVGFLDKFNYAPAILASLVTGEDAAMQELAARLNQLSGVSVASQKDEDAQKFVSHLYAFLGNNNIGLQAALGQDVKFGRDVVRSRSGTYLDLAVLFASACEAAGLSSTLSLTADNCLVTVKLPSGQKVTLDVTKPATAAIAKAQEEGSRLVREAKAKGLVYEVDLARWRAQGVRSIDLPPFDASVLAKEYRFAAGDQQVTATPGTATSPTTTTPSTTTTPGTTTQPGTAAVAKVDKTKLAGRWTCMESPEGRTVNYTLVVGADGSYSYRATVVADGKTTADNKEEGTIEVGDSQLKFTPNGSKQPNVYSFRLRGDELDLQYQGSPKLVTFQRMK